MVQAQGADSFRGFPFYLVTPSAIVFFILGTKNSKRQMVIARKKLQSMK
jgi:hypothetical protein